MPAGAVASNRSPACDQDVRNDKPQLSPACSMILGPCASSGFSEMDERKLRTCRNVSSVCRDHCAPMSQVPSSNQQPSSVCSKPAFMAKGPETTLRN